MTAGRAPPYAVVIALIFGAACSRTREPRADAHGRRWTTEPLAAVDGGLIAARLPRTVHRGGRFLRNPEVVTVTFAADDPGLVARLEAFDDTITQSSWWHEVVDSHCLAPDDCIGDGHAGAHVRLGDALVGDISDADLEKLLSREALAGGLSHLPTEALVIVYLPADVTLTDALHGRYCHGGPRAFHRALHSEGASFAYAVVARCGDENVLTGVASHEILEATTNPDPQHHGFGIEPSSPNLAFTAAGSEPVDACGLVTRDHHWTFESGFSVQRAWSNRAARAGHDPCVPAIPNRPYLALVPRVPVVRLPSVGSSAIIELDAVSDRAASSWSVSAIEVGAQNAADCGRPDADRYLEVELDRTTVSAGAVVHATLRAVKLHPQQRATVGFVSALGASADLWPLSVSMR